MNDWHEHIGLELFGYTIGPWLWCERKWELADSTPQECPYCGDMITND